MTPLIQFNDFCEFLQHNKFFIEHLRAVSVVWECLHMVFNSAIISHQVCSIQYYVWEGLYLFFLKLLRRNEQDKWTAIWCKVYCKFGFVLNVAVILLQLYCCSYIIAVILLQLCCCSYIVAVILLQLYCCSHIAAVSCCSYIVAVILLKLQLYFNSFMTGTVIK